MDRTPYLCARIGKFLLLLSLGLLPTVSGTTAGAADDLYEVPRLVALQNRAYPSINHGFTFGLGYLPADAFNKAFLAGASYTYNFSDFTAWEVVNFNYAMNIETDIKKDLAAIAIGVTGQNKPWLDYVNYLVSTSLIYTPFYSKNLLFNSAIVHSETSFLLGAGGAKFEFAGMKPIVTGGLIWKFFLGERTSLKFDFREHVYFDATGANGIFSMIIGLGYQMGSLPEKPKTPEGGDEIL